jgi:hypothetical protein
MKKIIKNFGFIKKEMMTFKKLRAPKKIQDFVDRLQYNLELKEETCYSPRKVLRLRTANCIEGAIFAAAALRVNGFKPLIIDLVANNRDDDHVIAVFQIDRCWGAIGKSKFTGLRFREGIYKTIRELVMSYFEDYFNEEGEKTLREFSARPVDLSIFDEKSWMTSNEHLWYIPEHLERIAHKKLLTKSQIRRLRKVPNLELRAGMLGYPRKH